MGKIAAQGAGVAIGTSSTSSTAAGANIEGDAYNFISELFIDPFPLLVDNQSSSGSLVFLVEMLSGA
jgi:hypothetical protein